MNTSKPRNSVDGQGPPTKGESNDPSCMPIEKCFDELETIVGALEDQTTSLEQSIALFERGMKLSQRCTSELARIEKNIQLIVENTRGEVQLRPFEAESNGDSSLD